MSNDMDQLEALADKATPGPWAWSATSDAGYDDCGPNLETAGNKWESCPYYCIWSEPDTNSRGTQRTPYEHEHRVRDEVVGSWGYDHYGVSVENDNAAFIAACDPGTIKTLISEARRLHAELDALHPTITTAEELEALPVGALIRCSERDPGTPFLAPGDLWEKYDDDGWGLMRDMPISSRTKNIPLPATVLDTPAASTLNNGDTK